MHPDKLRAYTKKAGKIIAPDHFNKSKRPRQCLLDDDLEIDVIDATVQSDEE
jgi:hypothetical protein